MWGALEIILAVAVCLALVVVTAACVCGCKKDSHKSELVGTAGVVKLRFEEEILPTQTTPLSGKRVSSQRSLPEIPPSVPRQDSGDTASDLYATVGTNQRVSERSSPSITRQSEHPYEHAYSRLQNGHRIEKQTIENETLVGNSSNALPLLSGINEDVPITHAESSVVITASTAISGQVSSSQELPYMTPPVSSIAAVSAAPDEIAPRPSNQQHFSGDSVDSAKGYTSITVRPPLEHFTSRTNAPPARTTPHYTSVSDDSDEMYAFIEEPLNQVYTSGSETYAQIQPANVQAIPPQTSTTDSIVNNTRAQSSIASNSSSTAVNPQLNDSIDSTSSKRSSVETSSTVHKHTRQASNSSNTETGGILSSPKPEKRQANSPLPPPPPATFTTDVPSGAIIQHKKVHSSPLHHTKHTKHKISSTGNLHDHDKLRRSLNEKHQRNNSCVSSSDFYGCNYPVDKHRFSSGDLGRPLVARELNFSFDKPADVKPSDAIYNTIDGSNDIYAAIDQETPRKSLTMNQTNVPSGSPIKNVEEMYAKVIKKSKHDRLQVTRSDSKPLENNSIPLRKKSVQNEDDKSKRYSGTNSTNGQDLNSKNNASMKVLNVQTLNKDDPGYETIDRVRNKNHGYETVDKTIVQKSDRSSDPGYETVRESNKSDKKNKTIPTVSGGLTQISDKKNDINEPGYETVPSGPESLLSNDPGYEHIRRERYISDSDPNYEVLRSRNSTPPYSSIRNKNSAGYSVVNKKPKDWSSNNNDNFSSEPNYESMPHDNIYNNSSESDPNYESVGPKDPNYESVKYFDGAIKDPPYEKVKHDTDNASVFHRSNSSSSYEKAKSILKHERLGDDKNDNKTNGSSLSFVAENAPVADYFQV